MKNKIYAYYHYFFDVTVYSILAMTFFYLAIVEDRLAVWGYILGSILIICAIIEAIKVVKKIKTMKPLVVDHLNRSKVAGESVLNMIWLFLLYLYWKDDMISSTLYIVTTSIFSVKALNIFVNLIFTSEKIEPSTKE